MRYDKKMKIIVLSKEKTPKQIRREIEVIPIKYALETYKTRKEAAEFLGISRTTLRQKIMMYHELKEYRNFHLMDSKEDQWRGEKYV